MMDLPRLNKKIDGRKRQRATTFNQTLGGYNHNLRTKAGEFYDMKNISLDNYPVIGTRQGFAARYLECNNFLGEGNVHGIHEYQENTVMAVFGKTLHVGITATSDGYILSNSTTLLEDSEKSFATIGTKTLIMPDKVIYDTSIINKNDSLYKVEKRYKYASFDDGAYYLLLHTIPCDIDGVTPALISETEVGPPTPVDGMWWYNASVSISQPRGWYEAKNNEWIKIEKSYTKLVPVLSSTENIYTPVNNPSSSATEKLNEVKNFFKSLNKFDSINIEGMGWDTSYGNIRGIQDGDYVIYGKDDDEKSIVIAGQTAGSVSQYDIRIKCPELEHIFALNNRVWGVNQDDHEIFACKLGNPTQWYNYANVASDSFALSLGNDKKITAGCAYNNTPHFFTEDTMIKIYGDYPSNYQTRMFEVDGVIDGGHNTLVRVEGILFWVSPIGVVAYEGSLPYFRGQDFAPDFLYGKYVSAGKDGTKYCLSVSHLEWESTLSLISDGIFAYDTKNGMWTKFSDDIIFKATELNNALCYVNKNYQIVTLYDRSRTSDWSRGYGENILLSYGRTRGGFVLDDKKYVYPICIKNNGSGEMSYDPDLPEEDEQVTATVNTDGVTVETLVEYWNESEYSGKEIGVGLPVKVTPGKNYALYFNHYDTTNGHVFTSLRDENNNTISAWKPGTASSRDTKSGAKGVIPDGAEWLYLVFNRHCVDGDIDAFYDLFLHEVPDPEEEPIEWFLETGNLGLDTPKQKYISRVQMRIDFIGSLNVDISYDDSEYIPVHVSQSDHMKSITVPIKVRRCDHFKLKLSGEGKMRLYSFGYETDEGSANA